MHGTGQAEQVRPGDHSSLVVFLRSHTPPDSKVWPLVNAFEVSHILSGYACSEGTAPVSWVIAVIAPPGVELGPFKTVRVAQQRRPSRHAAHFGEDKPSTDLTY